MSRVTEIRFVDYGVENLADEVGFYENQWGLDRVADRDDTVYFKTAGHSEHHVVRLSPAKANRVNLIGFAAPDKAAVDVLCEAMRDSGAMISREPAPLTSPGCGYGFRGFTPDGLEIEISSDVDQGAKRDLIPWEGIPVKISHIVLHSPDHHAMVQWFCDVLGFKISDWLGDFMCFLRCNEAHHRLAILPGPACLNHVAYDMLSVDDMMRGAHRLRGKGTDIQWGPGRHTAGNNTFSYFVTPSGFAVEYTAELEMVDFEGHEAKVHVPAPLVMDQWGIGTGGPQTMPHPHENPDLFVPLEA